MVRTMADILRTNMSREETIAYDSLQVCKYCKVATNHVISNCPKLAKKKARETQQRERELVSVKAKYGRTWYIQVEDTKYDCVEAQNLRMEDECREEEEYWREQEEIEEQDKKENLRKSSIENFLKEITPENAKERTEQLVSGKLDISPYDVHQCGRIHVNYHLVSQHMSNQLLNYLDMCEDDDDECYFWKGRQRFVSEEQSIRAKNERREQHSSMVVQGKLAKISI